MPFDTQTAPTPTGSTGCGCGGGCDRCSTGLATACRPRFFAGQLLTDADLTRLEEYVVAKDRLHNRYLVGTGVVCGLEVVCNPCDDTVTVRPGYALGPCGEDIVVPADTRVDVGALVRAQRRSTARIDCAPYKDMPASCEAAEQRWILGICYDERPARPVATLRSSASCAGACGGSCGASGGSWGGSGSSCGCSSATGTGMATSMSTSAVGTPAGCENTVTCEGFRFVLSPDTSALTDRRRPVPDGALDRQGEGLPGDPDGARDPGAQGPVAQGRRHLLLHAARGTARPPAARGVLRLRAPGSARRGRLPRARRPGGGRQGTAGAAADARHRHRPVPRVPLLGVAAAVPRRLRRRLRPARDAHGSRLRPAGARRLRLELAALRGHAPDARLLAELAAHRGGAAPGGEPRLLPAGGTPPVRRRRPAACLPGDRAGSPAGARGTPGGCGGSAAGSGRAGGAGRWRRDHVGRDRERPPGRPGCPARVAPGPRRLRRRRRSLGRRRGDRAGPDGRDRPAGPAGGVRCRVGRAVRGAGLRPRRRAGGVPAGGPRRRPADRGVPARRRRRPARPGQRRGRWASPRRAAPGNASRPRDPPSRRAGGPAGRPGVDRGAAGAAAHRPGPDDHGAAEGGGAQ